MYIKGEKVLLRAIECEDAEVLREMINDEFVERMVAGYSYPVARHNQLKWIENLSNDKSTFRAIIDVNGEAIGTVILSNIDMKNGVAEIHLKLLNNSVRGKGYGTDSVLSLLKYAFNDLRLNCVYCQIKEDNIISQRLFEKCGFTKEGCLRARLYKEGRYFDVFEYSILKREFEVK